MTHETKPHIELAGTVTIGPKGQVVIPADIREKMKIAAGDKLIALYIPEKEAISFVTEARLQTIIDKMGSHVEAFQTVLKESK